MLRASARLVKERCGGESSPTCSSYPSYDFPCRAEEAAKNCVKASLPMIMELKSERKSFAPSLNTAY